MHVSGNLEKMQVSLLPVNNNDALASVSSNLAQYQLRLGDQAYELNPLLGKTVRLEYSGSIHCVNCGRRTKKSFNQGHCYPCFQKLARCDNCMVKPETCHFEHGTCREPEWAKTFCFSDHIVYLANSSGLKVGITRKNQIPTRWIDQGAIQAIPLVRVSDRKLSGLVESFLAQDLADKTNWRAMLKGQVAPIDMLAERRNFEDKVIDHIINELEIDDFSRYSLMNTEAIDIDYPVLAYPNKVTSFNFDKTPLVEGQLMGIKGQYLILDTGVINLRKFGGYHIEFSVID